MFSKFVEEKKKKIDSDFTLYKLDNTNQIGIYNSTLQKINLDEIVNDIENKEDDINKIEEKYNQTNKVELFTRQNQYSKGVDEIIKVPKKIIKDEANILSDDKKENQIKNEIRKKENEQDEQKRKKEMELKSNQIKEYNDKIKNYLQTIKKKKFKLFIKYAIILVLIGAFLICLIIYIDKRKQ